MKEEENRKEERGGGEWGQIAAKYVLLAVLSRWSWVLDGKGYPPPPPLLFFFAGFFVYSLSLSLSFFGGEGEGKNE